MSTNTPSPSELQTLNTRYEERVKSILKSALTTRSMIQSFMDDIFKDVIERNVSYTPFNHLYNNLGKGVDKKSIKQWVHNFTPLHWDEEKQGFIRSKKKKWDRALLADGTRNPYFEWEKPAKEIVHKPIEVAKKYKVLANSVSKMIKEFHGAGLDATKLEAILATLAPVSTNN